ncbi:transcriptional regulator [Arboricoccus pini]|uniref:Transcriptional regulator n=1 Tax=Arboricoccus pini TaxID=1963835 RepID=A0A212RLB2_9PROT|nr:LysR family transcriptional regulator [Arboricoccus pini]SNB73176.1 transcriptional regulator [Arboricoccus pini]
MFIRQLGYLIALASERHFARAAASCHVAQPTLSTGIKQLEEQLGVLIVERGQRFRGFTPEGERVLRWARGILNDYQAMRDDLKQADGFTGALRLGAIPVAMPILPWLTGPFCAAHPHARVNLVSASSLEIERDLRTFDLDAGITYIDNEPIAHVQHVPLYRERYLLLTPALQAGGLQGPVHWADLGQLPLCLLTQRMQNRRIIDLNLDKAGVAVRPRIEVDSLTALAGHLRVGWLSTIVPESFLLTFDLPEGIAALELHDEAVGFTIGVVFTDRMPSTAVQAFLKAIDQEQLGHVMADRLAASTRHVILNGHHKFE